MSKLSTLPAFESDVDHSNVDAALTEMGRISESQRTASIVRKFDRILGDWMLRHPADAAKLIVVATAE